MGKLNLEEEKKEQRGSDTFVKVKLSEKDGDKSVSLELTLHDVKADDVDVKESGMCVTTKEGAPVYINFGKPLDNPMI